MGISVEQHTLYTRLSNTHDIEKMELLVEEFIDKGIDPNIHIKYPNEFQSVLGICCHRSATGAVHRLLAAGAKPHWPRKAISSISLTGGGGEDQYEGLSVDALGVTLEMLGGYLVEHAESERAPQMSLTEKVGGFVEITRALLLAGADPTRDDPAHGRKPLDSLMMQLLEDTSSPPDKQSHAILEDVLFLLTKYSSQLEAASEGKWKGSPLSDLDWADEYPALVKSVSTLAQKELLRATTPSRQRSGCKARL